MSSDELTLIWELYEDSYPSVTTADVEQLEKDIELELPSDFREAVVKYGGHRVEPCGIDVMMGKRLGKTILDPVYYISKESQYKNQYHNIYHILFEIREGELSYWMNRDERRYSVIPVAGGSSVGFFCYDYSLDTINPPVVWMNMAAWPEDDGLEGSMPVVASSFTDLLSKLHD